MLIFAASTVSACGAYAARQARRRPRPGTRIVYLELANPRRQRRDSQLPDVQEHEPRQLRQAGRQRWKSVEAHAEVGEEAQVAQVRRQGRDPVALGDGETDRRSSAPPDPPPPASVPPSTHRDLQKPKWEVGDAARELLLDEVIRHVEFSEESELAERRQALEGVVLEVQASEAGRQVGD